MNEVNNVFRTLTLKDNKNTGLVDCLNQLSDETLDSLCLTYKSLYDKKIPKKLNRDEKIKELVKIIPEAFKEIITSVNYTDIKSFENILKELEFTSQAFVFLTSGFIYLYENDVILPDELKEIYEKEITEEFIETKRKEQADHYCHSYLMINGIMPIEVMKDILINHHKLNVTEEEINGFLDEAMVLNDYYSIGGPDLLENLKPLKKDIPYLKFTNEEVEEYFRFIANLLDKISKILTEKHKELSVTILLNVISGADLEENEFFTFNLSKREIRSIIDIDNKYSSVIRYWPYNGRTIGEYDTLNVAEDACFESKLSDCSIDSCLDNIDELYLDDKCSKVNTLNKLEELIDSGDIELNKLLSINNKSIYEKAIDVKYFDYGFLYFYKDGKDIKYLVTDEVINRLKEDDSFIDEEDDALIDSYIQMNGVIKKEKLQELLKNQGNDYSIEELDKLVLNDYYILDDKYYSIFEDKEIVNFDDILRSKEKFGKYKEYDNSTFYEEIEFTHQLISIINNYADNEEIFSILMFLVKTNRFTKDFVGHVLTEYGINLKVRDELFSLYNEYKSVISVWPYNGYSVTEYNEMQKAIKKVGRNDPCPCGSGLKYKKCCGR